MGDKTFFLDNLRKLSNGKWRPRKLEFWLLSRYQDHFPNPIQRGGGGGHIVPPGKLSKISHHLEGFSLSDFDFSFLSIFI